MRASPCPLHSLSSKKETPVMSEPELTFLIRLFKPQPDLIKETLQYVPRKHSFDAVPLEANRTLDAAPASHSVLTIRFGEFIPISADNTTVVLLYEQNNQINYESIDAILAMLVALTDYVNVPTYLEIVSAAQSQMLSSLPRPQLMRVGRLAAVTIVWQPLTQAQKFSRLTKDSLIVRAVDAYVLRNDHSLFTPSQLTTVTEALNDVQSIVPDGVELPTII